jgi:hypothetical protein
MASEGGGSYIGEQQKDVAIVIRASRVGSHRNLTSAYELLLSLGKHFNRYKSASINFSSGFSKVKSHDRFLSGNTILAPGFKNQLAKLGMIQEKGTREGKGVGKRKEGKGTGLPHERWTRKKAG